MAVTPVFHDEQRSDAADYKKLLEGPWELDYQQLSPGNFTASNTGITLGDSVVYEEAFNQSVSVYGAMGPGLLGFSLPNRIARVRGRWWGQDFPESAISFATGGREIDVAFPDGYRNLLVLIPEQAFRDYFFDRTGEVPAFLDQSSPHLTVAPDVFARCRSALKSLIALPRGQKAPRDAILSVVATALASGPRDRTSQPTPDSSSLRSRMVRQAIEIWKASKYDSSILELSRTVGVSQRTLEHGFRDHFNLTPHQYLIRCRLGLAREALREADPARNRVTEIAIRYGFNELGRFAGEYRKFFGELPSETLAGRAGPSSALFSR